MRQNRKTRCQICGDVSKGVYYTATSCKSCMDFFRRCVIYKKQYKVNINFHKSWVCSRWLQKFESFHDSKKNLPRIFGRGLKKWNRYENLRKRHIIIVSKIIQNLNFGFASFSSDSSETLTLMTLQASFKHFWNSVSLTLIPYKGFEF